MRKLNILTMNQWSFWMELNHIAARRGYLSNISELLNKVVRKSFRPEHLMATVYIIGGPSRVGKSEIAKRIEAHKIYENKNPIYLQTDIIRMREDVQNIDFPASFIPDKNAEPRNEHAKFYVLEFLKTNDTPEYQSDIIIEGVAFDLPERTKDLALKHLKLKKVFIWHRESHIENVISYTKRVGDYKSSELLSKGEKQFRREVTKEILDRIQENLDIKERAKRFNWDYFETTDPGSPRTHIDLITEYLLRS